MVCSGGIFMMGKLVGGSKLTSPRMFSLIDNGKNMQLAPLPGNPDFVSLRDDGFSYLIRETPENKNLLELYNRVTTPIPPVPVDGKVIKMQ